MAGGHGGRPLIATVKVAAKPGFVSMKPIGVPHATEIFIFAAVWMLREIEVSVLRIKDIVLVKDTRIVAAAHGCART